jgi:hypothetical protein
MTAGGFSLDRDQRQQLDDCLKESGVALVEPVDRFFERIEASVDHYRRTLPAGTFREAHDSLWEIWRLCQGDHPSPARLRARLRSLPARALEYLGRRACIVIPQLLGEPFDRHPFEPPDRFTARFLA